MNFNTYLIKVIYLKSTRPSLPRDVRRCRLVVNLGIKYWSHLQELRSMTLEYGENVLSRNVGNPLRTYASQYPRSANVLPTSHRKSEISCL
jgi:hypothetical protein